MFNHLNGLDLHGPYAILAGNPPQVVAIENNHTNPSISGPFVLKNIAPQSVTFKCGEDSSIKTMKVWLNWACVVCGTNITPQRRLGENGIRNSACNAHGIQFRAVLKDKREDDKRIQNAMSVKNLLGPSDPEEKPVEDVPSVAQSSESSAISLDHLVNLSYASDAVRQALETELEKQEIMRISKKST